MNFLIAGLGNVGAEYAHTRHNIGFDVLDQVAQDQKITFNPNRYADYASFSSKGRHFHLIKPTTYMNLSGKAVRYWLQGLKLEPDRLLVIVDDVALPLGKLRLRPNGSDGGHNGLKDINDILGTSDYARLRFGIGSDFPRGQQIDYVLSAWSDQQWDVVQPKLKMAGEIIVNFGLIGIDRTMNQYNNL